MLYSKLHCQQGFKLKPFFYQIGLLYVFGLYMPINSFLLMFGNWGQHIFINPECPKSPYGYTYPPTRNLLSLSQGS